ncbi:GRIP1-associated protein 1-like isoform X2 [Gordionus sp. m RMFG-2023]|uniref:GRIP1-associated protein 1-like isoform X2 n=1 Tax=Gordionus sp. m RMFG-2023 TaxID=3053472 RepID=UPI0031FD7578
MYSEKDFQNIQDQLLILKEDNYKLLDTCRKYENDISIIKQEYFLTKQESEKYFKTIEKSRKIKEISLLLSDNESLHLKIQNQEEEFKLQNGTIMAELQYVLHHNEKLQEENKALIEQCLKPNNLEGDNSNSDIANETALATESIEHIPNIEQIIEKIRLKLDMPNEENLETLAELSTNLKNIISIANLSNTIKEPRSETNIELSIPLNDDFVKENEIKIKTLESQRHNQIPECYRNLVTVYKNIFECWNPCLQATSIGNKLDYLDERILKLANVLHMGLQPDIELLLKKLKSREESLNQCLASNRNYESRFVDCNQTISELTQTLDKTEAERDKRTNELVSQLDGYKKNYIEECLTATVMEKNLRSSEDRVKELQNDLQNLGSDLEEASRNFEAEIKQKDGLVNNLREEVKNLKEDNANLTRDLNELKDDYKICEKKLNSQLKDMKRQFVNEKKRAEKLQEFMSSSATTSKSFPASPQTQISYFGNPNNFVKSVSPSSIVSRNESYCNNATNTNYISDEDKNVSSWSLVSNGTNFVKNHNYGSNFTPNDENKVSLNAQKATNNVASTYQNQLNMLKETCNGTGENALLQERVKYLEESAAGLADDLMRKNEIIEKYAISENNKGMPLYAETNSEHSVASMDQPLKKLLALKFNNFINNNLNNLTTSSHFANNATGSNPSYEDLINTNKRLKIMLEETLTKNIMIEKDLEVMSKEICVIKNLTSAQKDFDGRESPPECPNEYENHIETHTSLNICTD